MTKTTSRRRLAARNQPLFALSLLPVMLSATGHASMVQAAPVLPTGGVVKAGSASIGAPTGGALTVSQSSGKAIIDWAGFSIGSGGKVQFNNGKGATLNRVTGTSLSAIDGLLSGTGSVYLINPNGVIVGKNGVVNVGGSFVASTLDVTNQNFLAGGDLSFAGASKGAVINYGKIGALGGDVALIASRVENDGSISAANGTAGLVAGYSVVLRDASLDNGKFSVLVGGADTSVANSGTIAAADAELRAEQGNVYALAGDTAGVVRATGVKAGDGKIWLTADGGSLDVAGTLDAQGKGGTPGAIETSGGTVNLGVADINAHGGTWTLDPTDLEITVSGAFDISNTLQGGTDVVEQTTATGASDSTGSANNMATAGGAGDITLDAGALISWNTPSTLTLSAYHDINIAGIISSFGTGAAILRADNTGTGAGTVNFTTGAVTSTGGGNVSIFYNPTSYDAPTDYSTSVTVTGGGALTAYMLVNTLQNLQDVNTNLAGAYALSRDIDASSTADTTAAGFNGGAGFTPIGLDSDNSSATQFTGLFDGQGHVVSGLTVAGNLTVAGLFGYINALGVVRNVGLLGGSVTGGTVGDLVGENDGSVTNAYATGSVTVSSLSGPFGGGLVGENTGAITNAYALGAVTGGDNNYVGGFVGRNDGTITASYSTGAVSGATGNGGFAGIDYGAETNTFYDNQTSGQSSGTALGTGGSATGLSTVDFMNPGSAISALLPSNGGAFVIVDTDGMLNGANEGDGATRPFLTSEYQTTITNAHQLQLMALNLGANYTLAADVDASETGALTGPGMWGAAGFVPIGGNDVTGFSGVFDGQNHSISDLTVNLAIFGEGGLFSVNNGTIQNVALVGGAVSSAEIGIKVAALVGNNFGTVINASASTTVTGTGDNQVVAGLVGFNGGSITGSHASGAVSGDTNSNAGGLVGRNAGVSGTASISNSYATGSVSAGPGSDVGGLVGYNDGYGMASISNSYATGPVVGGGDSYVGGLVGDNNGDSGTASISNSYATGPVAGGGDSYVGGLVGYNTESGGTASITDTYATGAVSSDGLNVGGLIGYTASPGSITYSYYDVQTTGQTGDIGNINSNTNPAAGSIGLTTAQMQSGSAVFDGNSAFSGGSAGLYPYLTSQFAAGTTPTAISGIAFSDGGVTALASNADGPEYVSALVDGTSLGRVTTGANGYYYFLAAPGAVNTTTGSALLTYTTAEGKTTGTLNGATLSTATGTVGRLDIWNNTLIAPTTETRLSAALVDVATPAALLGANTGADQALLNQATGQDSTGSFSTTITTDFGGVGYIATGAAGFTLDALLPTSGLYVQTTAGDIVVNDPTEELQVQGGVALSLESFGSIAVNTPITVSMPAEEVPQVRRAIEQVSDAGTVNLQASTDPDGSVNLTFAQGAGLTFADDSNGDPVGALTINGFGYTLVNKLDLLINNIADNGGGHYALSDLINANGDTYYGTPISPSGGFTGVLEGLGHTISNVNIESSDSNVGLFDVIASGGVVQNLGLVNVSVSGNTNGVYAGALAGTNNGVVRGVYALGGVVSASGKSPNVGGLVGLNGSSGTIRESYAVVNVQGGYSSGGNVGGLVGNNIGTISNAYAMGAVSASSGKYQGNFEEPLNASIGGLVGHNTGTITSAYATGYLTVTDNNGLTSNLGGLVGSSDGGAVSNGYFDYQTTGAVDTDGQPMDGAGAAGLTTAQLQSGLPTGFDPTVWGIIPGVSYPYFSSYFPTAPQVVSGTARESDSNDFANLSALTGVAVTVETGTDGVSSTITTASSGASGYYYSLLPAGSIAATASDVLAYISNGPEANSYIHGVTLGSSNSVTGLDLLENTLLIQSTSPNVSTMLTELASSGFGDRTNYTNGNLLLFRNVSVTPPGGTASTQAEPLDDVNLGFNEVGSTLNLDETIMAFGEGSPRLNVLGLNSLGTITQSAPIDAARLTGASLGGVTLNAANTVDILQSFSVASGGFSFTDNDAFDIEGDLTAAAQTVNLVSLGQIDQESGIITAGTLTGSSVGQASFASTVTTTVDGGDVTVGNQIANLGAFTVAASDAGEGNDGFSLLDAAPTLTVTGAVSVPAGNEIALGADAFSIPTGGSLSAPSDADGNGGQVALFPYTNGADMVISSNAADNPTLAPLDLTRISTGTLVLGEGSVNGFRGANNLVLGGAGDAIDLTNIAGTLDIEVSEAVTQGAGAALTVNTLIGDAGSVALPGANFIPNLGNFNTDDGGFGLADTAALSVLGRVETHNGAELALAADTIHLASSGGFLFGEGGGTVALAPYTAGTNMLVYDASRGSAPANFVGLALTTLDLDQVSTSEGYYLGENGTSIDGVIVLGRNDTAVVGGQDGARPVTAASIQLGGRGDVIDLTGSVANLDVEAASQVLQAYGATLVVNTLQGDAGSLYLPDPNNISNFEEFTAANGITLTSSAPTFRVFYADGGAGDVRLSSTSGPLFGEGVTTAGAIDLRSYGDITLHGARVTSTGGGAVTIYADTQAKGVGTVIFNNGAAVSTSGPVTIFYNPSSFNDPTTNSTQALTNGEEIVANPYTDDVVGASSLQAYMLVDNVTQLQALNTELDGVYALNGPINAGGASNFTPIGTDAAPFTGRLLGLGQAITGLTINQPALTDVGLFGAVGAGAGVGGVMLSGGSVTGGSNVGGLVGVNGGDVEFNTVSGTTVSATAAGGVAGGLIGDNFTGGGNNVVQATVSGAVAGGVAGENSGYLNVETVSGSVTGITAAGGVVGDNSGQVAFSASGASVFGGQGAQANFGGVAGSSSGTLISDTATGAVSGGPAWYVGGLVGNNTGYMIGDTARGAVSGASYVGGLIGYNNGDVHSSSATGGVNATASYAGGLAGYNASILVDSTASGPVTGAGAAGGLVGTNTGFIASSSTTSQVSGTGEVGGLVGENDGDIRNASASGAVSGSQDVGGLTGKNLGDLISVSATGTVTGSEFIGGLTGLNVGYVFGSYANGAASGTGFIGGLAGYNDGVFNDVYATGSASGASLVGGLVGADDNDGVIARAYSTGLVSQAFPGVVTNGYLGGFAGYNTGSVSFGYWDQDTSGTMLGIGNRIGTATAIGASVPGEDPTQAQTYVGFDFGNVWNIDPGVSRPYLIDNVQSPHPSE